LRKGAATAASRESALGDYHEPGNSIVSWRIAASTVHVCIRCGVSYSASPICDDCLRLANTDMSEKRSILFPRADGHADELSTVAVRGAGLARGNEKTSIARGLLRVLTWDVGA
jgi:hypothetical protein